MLRRAEDSMPADNRRRYLGVDVLIDSLIATIRTNGDVPASLRQTLEDNEIMLQRDPESMKQKAFGIETRNPVTEGAGPSKYLYRQLDFS